MKISVILYLVLGFAITSYSEEWNPALETQKKIDRLNQENLTQENKRKIKQAFQNDDYEYIKQFIDKNTGQIEAKFFYTSFADLIRTGQNQTPNCEKKEKVYSTLIESKLEIDANSNHFTDVVRLGCLKIIEDTKSKFSQEKRIAAYANLLNLIENTQVDMKFFEPMIGYIESDFKTMTSVECDKYSADKNYGCDFQNKIQAAKNEIDYCLGRKNFVAQNNKQQN